MFRLLLTGLLLAPLPALADCNIHSELARIGMLTAELHLHVPQQRHNEISLLISERIRGIHEVDQQGYEAAACDRAESLRSWIEREAGIPSKTRNQR